MGHKRGVATTMLIWVGVVVFLLMVTGALLVGIPRSRVDAEIERIKAIPARSAEEINAKTSRLAVAQARFNLVQKYRRRMAAKQPDTQPE